jgi:hypothetical protein
MAVWCEWRQAGGGIDVYSEDNWSSKTLDEIVGGWTQQLCL